MSDAETPTEAEVRKAANAVLSGEHDKTDLQTLREASGQ